VPLGYPLAPRQGICARFSPRDSGNTALEAFRVSGPRGAGDRPDGDGEERWTGARPIPETRVEALRRSQFEASAGDDRQESLELLDGRHRPGTHLVQSQSSPGLGAPSANGLNG
jgi:hypothetical protein